MKKFLEKMKKVNTEKEPADFTKYWKDKINKVNLENILLEKRVKQLEADVKKLTDFIGNTYNKAQTNTIAEPNTENKGDMPLKYNVIWVNFDSKTHRIKEWVGFDSVHEASTFCAVKESTIINTMKHIYKIIGTYTFFTPIEFFSDYFSKGATIINDDLFNDSYKLN